MKLFYMPGACSLAPHIVLEWIGKPFELGRIERGKTREPEFLAVRMYNERCRHNVSRSKFYLKVQSEG
jgi:hypothetical protein